MRILIKGGVWKNSEDEILKAAVMKYGLNNWSRVASLLIRKSARQCKARWYEWLDPSVKKTEWTREEEEKLLHLTKLFPTQWRTIAPIVGRTAHQCLEHYEKLLDRAQGRDTVDPDKDPRRLRPGEIDPNPETKPSRADPVDMDDDEKEMLSEARARLANTRGKKAKRKAREKQLDEARRMASLQKRRELKAAGIQTHKMRVKRKYINFAKEVPFEQVPPKGFYEVGADETPEGNLNFANISMQQLEGKRRVEEEDRLRKEDRRKLKRLQEENLPAAMEMIEKLNDPQTFRKRTQLTLPEPQLADHELDEIVRLGAENATLVGEEGKTAPTNALLSRYAQPPSLTPIRTPRRDNTILIEVQNAIARTTMQTPLEGGENPELMETPLGGGATPAVRAVRTPNPLAANLGNLTPFTSRGAGGATPSSVMGGMTPFRDDMSINEGMEEDPRTQKKNILMTQLQVKSMLEKLPQPQNEIEVAAPSLEEGEEHFNLISEEIEEDMEDIMKKRAEEERQKQIKEWKRETRVIQNGFPRPYFLSTVRFTAPDLPPVTSNVDEFLKADHLLNSEMELLLVNDAVKHPIKGMKFPKDIPFKEEISDEELERARSILDTEIISIKRKVDTLERSNQDQAKLWEEAIHSLVFSPSLGRYAFLHSLSKKDRLMAYKRTFGDLQFHLESSIKRLKKMESKYEIISAGYEKRLQTLLKNIEEHYTDYSNALSELNAFKNLRMVEAASAKQRKEEISKFVDSEKSKHQLMQNRYGELRVKREELLRRLVFAEA